MCSMEALQSLNLSKNAISELPQNIGKLVNLTYLDCSFNRLCQLPASLSHLENLEVLLLIDNVLELLPKEIGNLKKLTELNLYHNLLEDLPLSMKDLKADLVDLDYNPLTSIPALIRDEGWSSIQAFLSSDLMKRRKIKLRDHAQTVGQGVMGRDVPKLVELQIKLEEKKRMEERLAKAHKFDDTDFDVLKKAKQLFSKQVRTPKINDSTWLLFEGEKKFEKPNRKQRQTAINRALFEVAANEAKDE